MDHGRVALVTTDGFLYPNKVLEEKGLMLRKGFPESYDQKKVLNFLSAIKSGKPEVKAPVYSHLRYDIVSGQDIKVERPDILIFEGLNVLQRGMMPRGSLYLTFLTFQFMFMPKKNFCKIGLSLVFLSSKMVLLKTLIPISITFLN